MAVGDKEVQFADTLGTKTVLFGGKTLGVIQGLKNVSGHALDNVEVCVMCRRE